MKNKTPIKPAVLQKRILTWYVQNKRDLPWRKVRDPYPIWISEIMLQQTQVDTVIPYYHRFLEKFPTVGALARAPLQDVLKAWENLGYYSRARNLHAAAKEIADRMEGRMPRDRKVLLGLPGIGPYTAAAVLSFAFGEPIATVDGNVKRVLARVFAVEEPVDPGPTRRRLHDLASELVPKRNSSGFNQGLMDLGATVCTPRQPLCPNCPLQDLCLAFHRGLQEALPVSKKRGPLSHRDMTAAVIRDVTHRLLIVQRPPTGLLGGLWKFPGGEKIPRESVKRALKRTIKEELGMTVRPDKALVDVKHVYTHFRMTLHAWQCTLTEGRPRAKLCERWEWVEMERLSLFPFSRADRKVIEVL